jgi:PII-like signaling protein
MKVKRISILTYEGDRCHGDLVQRKLLAVLNEAGVETGATATDC